MIFLINPAIACLVAAFATRCSTAKATTSAFISLPQKPFQSHHAPKNPGVLRLRHNTAASQSLLRMSSSGVTSQKAAIDPNEFSKVVASNNLQSIIDYLESSNILSLTDAQLQSLFDTIHTATQNSDDNTVNTRIIQDAKAVEFGSLDESRAQMTKLYGMLRDAGRLRAFGAIAREPPKAIAGSTQYIGPIYPAVGSKIITPKLLEEVTGIEMINLTPQPTNFLLYGGAMLAILEGVTSLYFHLNFNLLVGLTLILAAADQILVSGAVFESALKIISPEMTKRITKHEAGHFLCAYLLGCPVEGVVLSTWAALQDGRFAGRATGGMSAGTSYYDLQLSEQIAGLKPLTRESIDRFSVIVMAGIAAEALEFGRANGGAGDEQAIVRFLRSLNPRSKNAVLSWSPELIRNQARWGATQAVLMMKEFKPLYDALVDALERGGDLGTCIVAIENAAAKEGLGWCSKPLGVIFEEGEFGRWAPGVDNYAISSKSDQEIIIDTTQGKTNGVPNYGESSITATEEILKMYREQMQNKLEQIDKQLTELEEKESK
jgi:hypothetical protein